MQSMKERGRMGPGVGMAVEMTMSLSGPPGFHHHHTTVPTESLYHYMNRPQHPQTSQSQQSQRLHQTTSQMQSLQHTRDSLRPGSMDTRMTSVGGMSHDISTMHRDTLPNDPGMANKDEQERVFQNEMQSGHASHQNQSLIIMDNQTFLHPHLQASQTSMASQHHTQHPLSIQSTSLPQQRRQQPPLRRPLPPENQHSSVDACHRRDSMPSCHSATIPPLVSHQQTGIALHDARTNTIPFDLPKASYDNISASYQLAKATNSNKALLSSHHPSEKTQGPPLNHNNVGIMGQSLTSSFAPTPTTSVTSVMSAPGEGHAHMPRLHSSAGQEPRHACLTSKEVKSLSSEEHHKLMIPLRHSSMDAEKSDITSHGIIQQRQGRDFVRDQRPVTDCREVNDSESIARSDAQKSQRSFQDYSLESMVEERRPPEESQRSSGFLHNSMSSLYDKMTIPHESMGSLQRGSTYVPVASDRTYQSGLQQQQSSGSQSAQCVPLHLTSPSDRNAYFSAPDQYHAVYMSKNSNVITRDHVVDERDQRVISQLNNPSKALPHSSINEDLGTQTTPKSSPSLHPSYPTNHAPLHNSGAPTPRGSIRTGQPRLLHETVSKPDRHAEPHRQFRSNDFSSRDDDRVTPCPPNYGARAGPNVTSQLDQSEDPNILRSDKPEVRNAPNPLDLTKLTQHPARPVDSPLDLTVKNKKRLSDSSLELQEFNRAMSGVKKQKLESVESRCDYVGNKLPLSSTEMVQNSVWMGSSSPRVFDTHEHVSLPMSTYSGHRSPVISTVPIQKQHKTISHPASGESDNHISVEGRLSMEGHQSVDIVKRNPSVSPHIASAKYGKMNISSVMPELVKSASNHPQMVPLTAQLQKVREEQAYQMKIEQQSSSSEPPNLSDPKKSQKDAFYQRQVEVVPIVGGQEMVVVRHQRQHHQPQNYDGQHQLQLQQQQVLHQMYLKQSQSSSQAPHGDTPGQHIHQQQLMMGSHHPQQLVQSKTMSGAPGQEDIIELGMKDSSDPLQASRSVVSNNSYLGTSHIHQSQHIFMNQRPYLKKDPQTSTYGHHQQLPYPKQMPHSASQTQTVYSKHNATVGQQQCPPSQFNKQKEEMDRFYQKQHHLQQQQQIAALSRKPIDNELLKSSPAGSQMPPQKWSHSAPQRNGKKTGPQSMLSPVVNRTDVQSMKANIMPSKAQPQDGGSLPKGRECDAFRYGYLKHGAGKVAEQSKRTLPQKAGPLPAGGVREESRRALSRRTSIPGNCNVSMDNVSDISGSCPSYKQNLANVPDRFMKMSDAESLYSYHMKTESQSTTEVNGTSRSTLSHFNKMVDECKPPSMLMPSNIIVPQNSSMSVEEKSSPLEASKLQAPPKFSSPLSVSIPPSPGSAQFSRASPVPSSVFSSSPCPSLSTLVVTSTVTRCTGPNKAWSRKQMILNAVNQDESLKRIISNTTNKHEVSGISTECKSRILASSNGSPVPTSPKMPILSPHEKDSEGNNREEPRIPITVDNNDDPPTLDPIRGRQGKLTLNRPFSHPAPLPTGEQSPQNNASAGNENCLVKEAYKINNNNVSTAINSNKVIVGHANSGMETSSDEVSGNTIVIRRCSLNTPLSDSSVPGQHQLEDNQKLPSGNVTFPRAETIRRNSLTGHALNDRPWGYLKNIPVANVAPFIHSRVEDENVKDKDESEEIISSQTVPSTGRQLISQNQNSPQPKDKSSSNEAQTKQSVISEDVVDENLKSKEESLGPASSSKCSVSPKRRKVTKLRVSSPTKMKEIELISPSLEFTVLKSSQMSDMQSFDRLIEGKKCMKQRLKYKQKIIKERNLNKSRRLIKKRIKYIYGQDEDDEVENDGGDELLSGNEEEEEVEEYTSSEKTEKADSSVTKARDREARALRREQLRDQSEESTPSRSSSLSLGRDSKSKEKAVHGKRRTSRRDQTQRSAKTAQGSSAKASKAVAQRLTRRRISSTSQRAQELKQNAITQRCFTGKRKIRHYNRNAAYEQELHRDANRRAFVRAKRQASSKARERLQQQQKDLLQEGDNDDQGADETWEVPETKGSTPGKSRSHQGVQSKSVVGSKSSGAKATNGASSKSSVSGSSSAQHKEDYESEVENVPSDLADEMAATDSTSSLWKKKARPKNIRPSEMGQDTRSEIGSDCGTEVSNLYESEASHDMTPSIPIEHVPVPAEVRKMTVNKNSGETLLHRAARNGNEEITLYCLKTQTIHVNARDNAGYTPLHESCVRGSLAVARHLLYYGADVNCCSQDGIRPIHDAIENDHLEVVRLLLIHGADPLIATYAGRTPVRIARSMPMLQTLQGYIGDVNGWSDDEEEEEEERERIEPIPWRFMSSLTFYESCEVDGCTLFNDMPGDAVDDSDDVFDDGPTSAVNVFNLALEGEERTPQPFCLLDDVLNRLGLPKEKLIALYPWQPTSVTLSSERVREVASCCCSNVSIRLPQTGTVTLLPFSTLKGIEGALMAQVKLEGDDGNAAANDCKDVASRKGESNGNSHRMRPIDSRTLLEESLGGMCLKELDKKRSKAKMSGASSLTVLPKDNSSSATWPLQATLHSSQPNPFPPAYSSHSTKSQPSAAGFDLHSPVSSHWQSPSSYSLSAIPSSSLPHQLDQAINQKSLSSSDHVSQHHHHHHQHHHHRHTSIGRLSAQQQQRQQLHLQKQHSCHKSGYLSEKETGDPHSAPASHSARHSNPAASTPRRGEKPIAVSSSSHHSKYGHSGNSSSLSRKGGKREDTSTDTQGSSTPMFSDDSSNSPFHTSIDCLDSDNSP